MDDLSDKGSRFQHSRIRQSAAPHPRPVAPWLGPGDPPAVPREACSGLGLARAVTSAHSAPGQPREHLVAPGCLPLASLLGWPFLGGWCGCGGEGRPGMGASISQTPAAVAAGPSPPPWRVCVAVNSDPPAAIIAPSPYARPSAVRRSRRKERTLGSEVLSAKSPGQSAP